MWLVIILSVMVRLIGSDMVGYIGDGGVTPSFPIEFGVRSV